MTTLREAAEMALTEIANARDYIWLLNEGGIGVSEKEMLEKMAKTIIDLRAALAEQTAPSDCSNSHQPDAWRTENRNEHGLPVFFCASEVKQAGPGLIPLYTSQPAQQKSVAWISVKDALPKAVRAVSYKASLTDVVLVRHQDRPDYPITAHAIVGEDLGAGVAIPTYGASEHTEIAWYSASSNLNNPFDLKNDNYDHYLPKIFGSKITHWTPLYTAPPQRKPLTDEEIVEAVREADLDWQAGWTLDEHEPNRFATLTRAIEAAHGIKEGA